MQIVGLFDVWEKQFNFFNTIDHFNKKVCTRQIKQTWKFVFFSKFGIISFLSLHCGQVLNKIYHVVTFSYHNSLVDVYIQLSPIE